MKRLALAVLVTLALAAATLRLWPKPPLSASIASSTAVFDAHGRLLRLTLASDQQYRLWTPLDQVSPPLVEALLLQEDRGFWHHFGIDPPALVRAALSTYSGGARQGGSTITMQLARLRWQLNTRTPLGKLRQMALAVWLELNHGKRELLEAHLNLLPYGGNIQGVGAASLIYFGKTADRLSLPEALTLVLVPQSPAARNPVTGETAGLARARMRLFESWASAHPEARDEEALMRMPLRYGGPRTLPFEAPHFTDALLAASRDGATLESTLDLNLQRLVERQLGAYVRAQSRVGIANASALLVDTRDLSIKAMVGSAGFFDPAIQGQVNGTLAKRSPGSALKPFLYALAMDQGLIHPLTVLKDAPVAFGPFSPENFDGSFVGPLTATEALIRSRNVPAVTLSARLTSPTLYQFLRSAGVSRLASEQHYGLALALGGGEVTMEELAMLYAMLANRGELQPLRWRKSDTGATPVRLLSEEASFLALDMLAANTRPDLPLVQRTGRLPVYWKTGTSWGFRDAWTAGIFGPYVLVVWVGNFDGVGNPAFVGLQAAAPLFFRIVDAVQAAAPSLREPVRHPPANLARVDVCAASGDLPNADCPQTASTWFIPGRSPIRVSQVHRRLAIDEVTGRQACAPYANRKVRFEVFEFWPSDLQKLFAQAGVPRRAPPPPGDCSTSGREGAAPAITSPRTGVVYTLREDAPSHRNVPLAANADGDVRTLYWFVDDAYVGTGRPGIAIPWSPARSGRYTVRAVDERGRVDSREMEVAFVR